jgi:dihydroxy-acid dehydratase
MLGAFASKRINEAEFDDFLHHACPGPGACGGMFTANTMSSALEVMGMSLPYSASIPAIYQGAFLAGSLLEETHP